MPALPGGGSVVPLVINLIHIHPTAGEIVVGGQEEGPGSPVIGQDDGFGGCVGVVSEENDFFISLFCAEKDDRVIYG